MCDYLSPAVAAAVAPAIQEIERLIASLAEPAQASHA
jgi:hypothetical protein